jgi:peptide/nickel transport system substrate-binding protein
MSTRIATVVAAACLFLAPCAHSAELRVGLAASTTSMDPQFYVVGPNSAMARNIFDGLINQDNAQRLVPALALSWKPVDDTTWVFALRPSVKFHDGSDFTSADVVASIKRVALASANSPSSFMPYVQDIAEVEAQGPLAVRIRTKAPAPLLPNNLSRIAILPQGAGSLPTATLNAGQGVIGTGPYRFVSWSPDDKVVLERNATYWGDAPDWERVTFRIIKNPSARTAALLAGDVEAIEAVPTTDIKSIEGNAGLKLVSVASNRVMYLHMDQARDISPFAAGADGRNPLVKTEVRRAMSLAINRQALVDRVMDGQGVPAGQLVPDHYFGWSPTLKPDPFDLPRAKALLAKAGYPDGFTLTFHASNDRYPNDARLAQAIGQMLTRAGIKVSVETMPGSVYFARASKLEFSLIMGGAAVETGEAASVLGPLLATFSPTTGQGNRGRYSSPAFDAALNTAMATVDAPARDALLQKAMEIGMGDVGVMPLFFLGNTWAVKSNLAMQGRADGYTLASDIHPKK